jgi:hypothetical protein
MILRKAECKPRLTPFADFISGLKFPHFFNPLNRIQPSLIFPILAELKPNLPRVSIVRPLYDKFGGAAAYRGSDTLRFPILL